MEGFAVTTAEDGEEALACFAARPFDIVLLDVMMPKRDGFDVCRSIRQHSSVPIIMITARGEDFERIMGLDIGADDVLTNEDGSIEVITPPYDYLTVKEALETAGFTSEFGQVTMKAENEVELVGEDAERMQKLIDALEGLDDVQEVYTSVVMDE